MPIFFSCPANKKRLLFLLTLLTGAVAFYLRTSGLFRGLGPGGSTFHPDEAKQVLALFNFLHGVYVRYYGSIFYDGYPYGLNHLDEYLLRPLSFFLGALPLDQDALFYFARMLRVAYGMATILMTSAIVFRLTVSKVASLAAMLLQAISPLAITVTHFATGDVGVDFFTATCLLCTLIYLEQPEKKFWLVASGFAVGAAFSAKYNGMLTGITPAVALFMLYIPGRQFRTFLLQCCLFAGGLFIGILVFTPNLLLDFSTSLKYIFANFEFIKNYNVPPEFLARPWIERALAGLRENSPKIITALGTALFAATLLRLFVTGTLLMRQEKINPRGSYLHGDIFILSITIFPIAALLIALSGKYIVQPFHFSSLQIPMIIALSTLITTGAGYSPWQSHSTTAAGARYEFLTKKEGTWLQVAGLLLLAYTLVEFGLISQKDNFFWRRDDTASYVYALPKSIYTRESIQTQRGGVIRSIFLEQDTNSVFRNLYTWATGPDAELWNIIRIAPLPQVPNPAQFNWVFLNGPTFPINERIFFLRGATYGTRMKKDLVLPAGQELPTFGVRCGSYPTSVTIQFGQNKVTVDLEAHQQKTISMQPGTWRTSTGLVPKQEVRIIPLIVSIPHNDASLTLLLTPEERNLFNLFGGGQEGPPTPPEKFPDEIEERLGAALSSIRYLEADFNRAVQASTLLPFWEILLPAGHYTGSFELRGLTDDTSINIFLEDANGKGPGRALQNFHLTRGKQVISYHFTKPFVPYQGRLVLQVLKGKCILLSGKIIPNRERLSRDFEHWRLTHTRPDWVSRY